MCSTLGVSASAYNRRASGQRSARAVVDERLLARTEALHAANYHAYGYRRTWLALRRAGVEVGRDRVTRLMRRGRHRGRQAARQATAHHDTRSGGAASTGSGPARLQRLASRPAVSGGLHLLRCGEGVVFFSFVIDAFSRRVVAWKFAAHMRTDLLLDALRMALAPPVGRRRRARAPLPRRQPVHQLRLYAGARRSRRAGRRSVRSATPTTTRWRRAVVDSFKIGADHRPRLARPVPARTRDRLAQPDRLLQALGDLPPAECERKALPSATVPDSPASPARVHR
jgi:hypothetical protein